MQLALFPLPVFLLPGGVTRLRIFEQRYIRLVQESAGDVGFVLASPYISFEPNVEENNWGAWVKIIDFETGDDGLLLIDIKCEEMVKIHSMSIENDGLKRGSVSTFSHWSDEILNLSSGKVNQQLTKQLQTLYRENPALAALYPRPNFDSLTWVCQRWLEILPLKPDEQNLFVQPDSFAKGYEFLQSVVIR